MAEFLSNHYTAGALLTPPSIGTIDNPRIKAPPGEGHSRLYFKRATILVPDTADEATPDVLRFFPMSSSDRLYSLQLSNPAGGTTLTVSYGIYATDQGAALDSELFVADFNTASVTVYGDLLIGNAKLTEDSVGAQLWEMADQSSSLTYAADPFETWDICGTVTVATTLLEKSVTMTAIYSAPGA